jgi:hypothetical protein
MMPEEGAGAVHPESTKHVRRKWSSRQRLWNRNKPKGINHLGIVLGGVDGLEPASLT